MSVPNVAVRTLFFRELVHNALKPSFMKLFLLLELYEWIWIQQHKKEPMLRELIDRIIETGQVDFDGEYVIEWIDPFEVNPQDKAAIEFLEARTIATMGPYMKVNEARKMMKLSPLQDKRGEELVTLPGQLGNPSVGGPENQGLG